MTSTTSFLVRFAACALLVANTLAMPTTRMYYAPAPTSPPAPKTSSSGGGGGSYRKPAPMKKPKTSSGYPATGGCHDTPVPKPQTWPQTSSSGGNSGPKAPNSYYKPAPKTQWKPAPKPATASQSFGSDPAPAWKPKPQTASAGGQKWDSGPTQQTSPQTVWRPAPAAAPAQQWAPAPAAAPAQQWAPAPAAAPAQQWAPAPAAAPAQQWVPSTPTPTSSPSASPWPSPVPPAGSSIDLGDTEASATGNNTLSVGAEADKAAAAGNGVDGNALILGATPGQAIGINAPFAGYSS